ncbi:hypothetical protein [Robertkochia sediminum]|uniref:hypothetical protein n=1 Tax=Robertkochia sediminum TaxID=2785326 RepID=UPI00193409DC|nr:hypothetical protein [Robertkochia sediminum]MBL7472226.1 hypothetical protein [Robertkochia sediminum]
MDFFRKRQIQIELDKISQHQWEEICTRCKSFLRKKLFNKTNFGAHSERDLGLPAIDYYFEEAVSKIFTFEWEWQFEKYSIVEQIIRIAGSMISKNVEKYRRKMEKGYFETEYSDNMAYDLFDEVYDESIDKLLECIERIVKEGDAFMQMHWESIKEGLKSKQIAEIIEKPVNYVYRQNEKLIYHAKTKCLTVHDE